MKQYLFSFLFLMTMNMTSQNFLDRLQPLTSDSDLDPMIAAAGGKKLVLLGEASHGTHEFYLWRDKISRRLIAEHDFDFIAVEGDFASLYELNRYVKNKRGAGNSAREVLSGLERWPTWMWKNEEVAALAEWLRKHNDNLPEEKKVGFYGMDVYDEWHSKEKVLEILEKVNPTILKYVQNQYDCFNPYKGRSWDYARAVKMGRRDCSESTENVVKFIRNNREKFDVLSDDEYFYLLQNAIVVHNAEEFYRESVVSEDAVSWNSRVFHMTSTVNDLLKIYGENSKGIVWAHNTHIGDASYTNMRNSGEKNIGQLSRESLGSNNVFLIGFATNEGTVMAGSQWDEPMKEMRIPPAIRGSLESKLSKTGISSGFVIFNREDRMEENLKVLGHRAIGVVYNPKRDRYQFVPTLVPMRYDALIFFEKTEAVHVLE